MANPIDALLITFVGAQAPELSEILEIYPEVLCLLPFADDLYRSEYGQGVEGWDVFGEDSEDGGTGFRRIEKLLAGSSDFYRGVRTVVKSSDSFKSRRGWIRARHINVENADGDLIPCGLEITTGDHETLQVLYLAPYAIIELG